MEPKRKTTFHVHSANVKAYARYAIIFEKSVKTISSKWRAPIWRRYLWAPMMIGSREARNKCAGLNLVCSPCRETGLTQEQIGAAYLLTPQLYRCGTLRSKHSENKKDSYLTARGIFEKARALACESDRRRVCLWREWWALFYFEKCSKVVVNLTSCCS